MEGVKEIYWEPGLLSIFRNFHSPLPVKGEECQDYRERRVGRLICTSLDCPLSEASICKIFNQASGDMCHIWFTFHIPVAKALLPLQFLLSSGMSGMVSVWIFREIIWDVQQLWSHQKERVVTWETCLYRAGQWRELLWGQIKKGVTHGAFEAQDAYPTSTAAHAPGPLGVFRMYFGNLTGLGSF